ncbi:tumor necrosis factor alpha-induced protein 2-like isoform X2 [Acipenser ruthenus]|uniref:tumor necrosis factor alpha-induced protein 2-like isoform X2 n=1 Tax=Acipenser ruthenus TaxID=7906 RepID=UPI00145A18AE|nr:tumor necrosis factor alpha-induced protein 2-like isoform X2 [Acipenser ruthenus]
MPVLKSLPGKIRGSKRSRNLGTPSTAPGVLILGTMNGEANLCEEEEEGGGANPFEEEEGGVSPARPSPDPLKEEERSSPLRGTLDRIRGVSPLKTLGKLGKGLRSSIRGKGTPGEEKTPSRSSEKDKRKSSRRSSEEQISILSRLPGKRKESLSNGEPSPPEREGGEGDPKRRLSFLKIGLGGKIRHESQADKLSLEREGERAEEEREGEKEEEKKKVKEPLSVLEILRLVMKRDLFVADTHILELERECEGGGGAEGGAEETGGQCRDSGRKLKDVELLYEALLKELGEVVRESLLPDSLAPPPALPLLLQVIEQEEQADREWAEREAGAPEGLSRPRQLRRKWKESVAESASSRLPCRGDAGALSGFLGALSEHVVQDLCAVKRSALPCYPPEYEAFTVHLQSYHQAVGQRLREAAAAELHITELHTLLDWVHNTYHREVLDHSAFKELTSGSQLSPLLPLDTLSKLERDYVSFVKMVTEELSEDLDAEERRWGESLQIEEYQSSLANNVIAKLQIHLDRASRITAELGARVAHCCLSGLADFLQSFQKKVEVFHQYQTESGNPAEGFTPRTIALVNCCPPFRSFLQRCAQCESQDCEEGLRRGMAALDKIVSLGVKVLVEQLFPQIKPHFEKLVKRKWLNNTEAFDSITETIRSHFKTFCRMEGPPYQALVCEVHRRVLVEYLRALMRGRIICTSAKKRRKMSGRLRDEGKQIKELFRELDSGSSWLDSAVPHISEIIVLEDTPSIQMEVGVLVREYPDVRKKHVAALLDLRGMLRQVERMEILNIVKDLESSLQPLPRDRALFSELPVTSEARCLNLGLSRVAITTSSMLTLLRERAGRGRGERRSSSERAESGERGERREERGGLSRVAITTSSLRTLLRERVGRGRGERESKREREEREEEEKL